MNLPMLDESACERARFTDGLGRVWDVAVPTAVDAAQAYFACHPVRARLISGTACAGRHRKAQEERAPVGACVDCPAGAARARLIPIAEPVEHQARRRSYNRMTRSQLARCEQREKTVTASTPDETPAPTPAATAKRRSTKKRAKPRDPATMTLADLHQAFCAYGPCTQAAIRKEWGTSSAWMSRNTKRLINAGAVVQEPDTGLYSGVEDAIVEAPTSPDERLLASLCDVLSCNRATLIARAKSLLNPSPWGDPRPLALAMGQPVVESFDDAVERYSQMAARVKRLEAQLAENANAGRVQDLARIDQAIGSIADIQADDADRLGVLLDLANSAKAVIVQLGVPRTTAARSMPKRVESIRDDMLGMYDQLAKIRALLKIDVATDAALALEAATHTMLAREAELEKLREVLEALEGAHQILCERHAKSEEALSDCVSKLEDTEHRVEDARLAFDLLVERFARQVKREEQIISTSAALFADLLSRSAPQIDINDLTAARA